MYLPVNEYLLRAFWASLDNPTIHVIFHSEEAYGKKKKKKSGNVLSKIKINKRRLYLDFQKELLKETPVWETKRNKNAVLALDLHSMI